MTAAILPGATLGVLGSGQLGRMFAIAARRLGYRVHVLSPDDDTPTGQVADREINAPYDDLDAVAELARGVSVVTFEFENVPAPTAQCAARFAPVRPGGTVLHVSQNRRREKSFLHDAGLPVTPFIPVKNPEDLCRGLAELGVPAVLKTAAWGYDGKGQTLVRSLDDAETAWTELGADEAILEQFVPFDSELSVIGARAVDGSCALYEPIANTHRNHILDLSLAPAALTDSVARQAHEITRTVLERLEVVGVLCVEFFLVGGELLINELAPRPHNSGHLTIDAHVTCQFEQQVRAVCGLPLGSTGRTSPAAMANLLGDLWTPAPPAWRRVFAAPDVKLHLYGKRTPRQGRKMGHLTALADSATAAAERVLMARRALAAPAHERS